MSEAEAQVVAPEGIRAFDQDGREVMVPREQWAKDILPNMLKEAWEHPDQLYMLILNSLNDGFLAEVSDAAEHLYAIDPMPARGACMWAIVLIQTARLDEAEAVLTGFAEKHGDDGSVLVNLAKVYAAQGDQPRAERTLARALEVEPNLDNGLGWFATLARERGGEEAAAAALEQVRKMPASWRAQLWLARNELVAGNLAAATALYGEALERAPRPVPPELLMQMSGDLGGHGKLAELVEFTAPHFLPEFHGLPVGNNLIKAHVDQGNLEAAAAIVEALTQFNRPDWRNPLGFWDGEIKKRKSGSTAVAPQEIQIGMLRVDGPVWLPPGSPARGIFGAKAVGSPAVTFLGGTAEAPEEATQASGEELGRLTRSLPLYLAEQTEMRTAAAGRAMLPWAVGSEGSRASGFVVGAARWTDAIAVQAVAEPANRSDYVVTVHLDAEVEPWEATLVFLRTSDGARIGELSAEFAPDELADALPKLADEVVELLSAFGEAHTPVHYVVPEAFPVYLSQLEQLLAIRCATVEGEPGQALRGERATIEGALALSAGAPENVPVRLLLVETMGAMQRAKPEIAGEFAGRFQELVSEKRLAMVDAAFLRS